MSNHEHESMEPEAVVVQWSGIALLLISLAILFWAYGLGAVIFGLMAAAGLYLALVAQVAKEVGRASRDQDA